MMNENDLKTYLKEVEEVTSIESPTNYPAGVNEAIKWFEKKASSLNFQTKTIDVGSEVGNCLIVSNNLNAENFNVLLLGHADTVFPVGTGKNAPFRIEGDRAKSLGIIDDKGCVLMALYALSKLEDKDINFAFLINSCEETGSTPSTELIKEYAKKSKYCLVLEPAREDGSLVATRKGYIKYKIDFNGISAHAGNNPQRGASAVNEAANLIVGLANINDYKEGHTFNTIMYKGGDALNVIPEFASVGLEVRYVKDSSIDFIENKMKEVLSKPLNDKVKYTITKVEQKYPMFDEKNLPFMKSVIEEAGKETGVNITWVNAGGGSDGNITSMVGCPTIDGLGPVGGNMHNKEEYLEIDSVIPRCNLLIASIKKFAKK
ncbi:MAG: M20/M25/M40 family metallo-hydrolase [Alphaproteobacteria bacterium]|jgi:glutamate carboxypeptidase|nr:M20/M25/M40 family metallo-hydrolase [Alphaproteobacteria bacterium]